MTLDSKPGQAFTNRLRIAKEYELAVCEACSVVGECLAYAVSHDERFGIWGGLFPYERRKLA